ncbi:uncharacterized protein LOC119720044 [Patiria miniata]|uniref:Methyltransferase domain-containing protein n=1 Tax=Patiria miniata TaxID=46514 RepID=A0A913Z1D7_PATMI|nr:uncharacterized protein LOC119720044 [Patiria miniata]
MATTKDGDNPVEALTSYRKEAYSLGSSEEGGGKTALSFYNTWAEKYDKVNLEGGYQGAVHMAAMASEIIHDKSARILDAAAGTGLVGRELKNLGFTCIDALDPSKALLDKCKEHQSHKEYICDTLDAHRLDIPDNHYDAVLMAAAFGVPGHVDESCFPELIRITKPGGHIMYTLTEKVFEQVESRMEAAIKALAQEGRWEFVEYRWLQYYLNEELNEKAKVPILRVLPK